jgi:hypothetical protein
VEDTVIIRRWWCRLTLRHRGEVGYILNSGPYWMCDNCGEVVR